MGYVGLSRGNPYNERLATLALPPDVPGKRRLDIGYRPGISGELLLEHGAEVVAIDANTAMVRLARQRLQNRAPVTHTEPGRPLDFLSDESFDVVISPPVLDDVKTGRRPSPGSIAYCGVAAPLSSSSHIRRPNVRSTACEH